MRTIQEHKYKHPSLKTGSLLVYITSLINNNNNNNNNNIYCPIQCKNVIQC